MARRIVVMGVSGCGKSTIGKLLSRKLGYPFLEGDSFHPPENVQAMASGQALNDRMREPWLLSLAAAIAQESDGVVVSCSALRKSYRDILRANGPVFLVHLTLDLPEARRRMEMRRGHFMNPALAESQLASLEALSADEHGVTLDATMPPNKLVERALAALTRSPDTVSQA